MTEQDHAQLTTEPRSKNLPSFEPDQSIATAFSPSESGARLAHKGTISRQLAGARDVSSREMEVSEGNFLGLKVVYRPPTERRVDIILVHGLGGGSRSTWSKNHDPNFFWPLHFLPNEPDISEARISTFGYNANFRPGSGKTKVSILDFAKDLLYDLKYAQDESTSDMEDLQLGEASFVGIAVSWSALTP